MIEAASLRKTFGATLAVDGVSFAVAPGEVLGFLGPNGAGKSTTMRMLTGFIPPTAGAARIGGHDVVASPLAAKALIGYLPENAPLYPDMTVDGFLRFAAEVRGLWGQARAAAVSRVIETCYLQPVARQAVDTLSKGYRHRTCLAQALLHDPPVLVLDEPTDGLDPNQKHEVRNLIRRMGQEKAIILSTHILEEVDAVCTRALIIDRGRVVANGRPADLRAAAPSAGTVQVRVQGVPTATLKDAFQTLTGVQKVIIVAETPQGVCLQLRPRRSDGRPLPLAAAAAELLTARRWRFDELSLDEGRLDEFFRSVTVSETGSAEALT